MDPNEIQACFFTERFQQVYRHLYLWSCLYVLQGHQGISEQDFLREFPDCRREMPEVLAFLSDQELLIQKQGLLHLNSSLFFTLSVWDLLIRVEPWMRRPPVYRGERETQEMQEYRAIRVFAQTHGLSDSYMHPGW